MMLGAAGIRADVFLTANLIVHLNASIPILSPGRLFGSFFEEYLHAGDGGIYAEKITNRAMQLPLINHSGFANDTQDLGWTIIQGQVIRDSSWPLNQITQDALWLSPAKDSPAIVRNTGFPGGMAVQPGEDLELSLFVYLKGNDEDISLAASLVRADASQQSIASSIVIPPRHEDGQLKRWRKVHITMKVPKHTKNQSAESIPCQFQLQARSTATSNASTVVGVTVVSLISLERTWKYNGLFRQDVIKWLEESRPPFLRIPGGNFIEGLQSSGEWNWKQTLGPIENRPGHNNDRWGYFTSDGLGMFEYLLLAEEIGAKPLLVVNAGCTMTACVTNDAALEKYIQDAVDAVEFATGDPKVTYWGAQRAAAGHTSPFALEALGIGNENCRPLHLPHYAHNWLRVAVAVRAHNPSLPLVLGCETFDQMQNILQIEPQIGKLGNLMYDIHQRHDPKSFLRNAHYFDTIPRNESKGIIKAFVSEYSSPREAFPEGVDLGGAVAEAIFMLGMEANGDAVQLASYGDLLANRHDLDKKEHAASGIATILLDANASFGTPSWVVQTLFMQHQPHALVPSSLLDVAQHNNTVPSLLQVSRWRNGGTVTYGDKPSKNGEGMLATSVSTGGNQCALVVKVANYGQASASINIQLPEHKGPLPREADLRWITGLAPTDRNSMEEPRRIRIQQKRIPVNMSARQVALFIPPFSLSVLCLKLLSRIPLGVL